MNNKKSFILFFLVFFSSFVFAQVINDSQMIQSSHWIYDYFNKLELETGISLFTDNSPMSVAEAKYNLRKINRDSLSESGCTVYDAIDAFISQREYLYSDGPFAADTEIDVTVEGYCKTNEYIPWVFDYNYDGSAATVPIKFAFTDSVTLETDVFLEKNWFAVQKPDNLTNIPFSFDDIRFQFPDYAYGSFVSIFNDWGVSFQIGKQGRCIGYTETGSIVYNDTFETDMYSSLSLFSPTFKYTLDVSQVSYDQFLYMHQVQGIFFSKLKLTYLQAAMINDSFSLRQINPMMVMHSFMGNYENTEPWEVEYYNESDVCAYLALMFDYYPVKKLRIYGSYVQTEIQAPSEQFGPFITIPNGLGGQLGISYLIPSGKNASYKFNVETIYTTPFLYIKQTPRTSLCRLRYYNEIPGTNEYEPVATWIGTPYGPDCFAVNSSMEYEVTRKWSVKADYLFKIHGDNYADMLFDRGENHINYVEKTVTDKDGTEHNQKIYNYYPFAKFKLAGNGDKTEIIEEATNLWMSGIPEYEHQITVSGSYSINQNWSLKGLFAYDLLFNCKNIQDNLQSGFEAVLSCSFKY